MAHQVVGPNFLPRIRKTEQQKIHFNGFLENLKDSEKWQGWGSPEETDGLPSLWICSHFVCEAIGNSESNQEAERPRS